MVCYIKEFGRHGADPAKIFVDKNGNIADWKSVERQNQNGTIQVPCTEIEYCELNDCDFRILPVFNQTQSTQPAPQSKPCEVSNDYVDDDIPF